MIGLLLVSAGCSAARSSYVDVSQVVTYRLTHRTRIEFTSPVEVLRVYHARPIQPTWMSSNTLWISEPTLMPPDAVWQPAQKGGSWWRWERNGVEPGVHVFETRFDVTTAHRALRTGRLQLTWDEVADAAHDVPDGQRAKPVNVPEPLRRVARDIRARHTDPVEAVRAVTAWIAANIAYSVDVDYGTNDLGSIVRGRKGWCGHRLTVFQALSQELLIPARAAIGFNARNQEGFWDGRSDWNRHAWAEIRLPRVGWVEVEPSDPRAPFAIPPTYIKNPPELQSHAVWVRRGGRWGGHKKYHNTIRVELVPASF
jgi:transglutaminase-like putative cysteine protease